MSLKRIVLLCGPGYSSEAVCAALTAIEAGVTVIQERQPSRWKAFRRRLARQGLRVAVGQVAFRLALVPWLRLIARSRLSELRNDIFTPAFREFIPDYTVNSANDSDTQALLESLAPDVVVVNGTRILGPEILSAVSAPFINMHAGITPAYRGVHGGYWALASGQPNLFGVTIHRVDRGVDTGEVLARSFVTPTTRDNFVSYPFLQLRAGLPMLRRVCEAELGICELRPVGGLDLPSKQYFHPTLGSYLSARWRLGVK